MAKKYQHPCNSVRKYNPSQKIVAVANVLVLACLFFGLHWNKSDTISHKTPKNALEKIIGTLNLIFGSTLLDKITEINRSLWPWMSFSHLSTGILDYSSFANCSRSFRFKGCLLPTAVWDLSTGVLWDSDLDSLLAISELTCALFVTLSECFLKCVSGHCPAGRPMTSGGDAAFWHWPLCCAPKILWLSSDFIILFTQSRHPVPEAAKPLWTSTIFNCRDCVLFFEGLISFSVNSAMMSFTKKLYFCLICS